MRMAAKKNSPKKALEIFNQMIKGSVIKPKPKPKKKKNAN